MAQAIGAAISLVGISYGFEKSFLRLYENAGVDMVVTRAGGGRQRMNHIPEFLGPMIKDVPGVKEVLYGLVDVTSFEDPPLVSVVLQGWEPETAVFNHLTVKDGRLLRKGEPRAIMLGTTMASNLGKGVDDTVEVVIGEKYHVVGVYETGIPYEDGAIVMTLSELQRLMDRKGMVTGFSLILDRPRDEAAVNDIRRRIEALEVQLRVLGQATMAQGMSAVPNPGTALIPPVALTLDLAALQPPAPRLSALPTEKFVKSISEIRLAKAMSFVSSAIALFLGLFGITNTMVMSVTERTREIGILRAVGWQMPRVVRMIMLEAVFLSLMGAAVGIIVAEVLVQVLTHVPTVNGVISGRIQPMFIGYGLAVAVILGVLGSILPAIRANRMLPTEALRHE
jgi:putative ABC transport system permease protein